MTDFDVINYNFTHNNFSDYDWGAPDWDLTLPTITSTFPIPFEITISLHLGFSGIIHVDILDMCGWVRANLEAGFEVEGYIQGHLWSGTVWDLIACKLTGKNFEWQGSQPFFVIPLILPSASLTVGIDGRLDFDFHPQAEYWVKAGADIDWEWLPPHFEFHTIFEYGGTGFSFENTYNVSIEAWVKPAVGASISMLVLGIIGPEFTVEFYDQIALGYNISEHKPYWHAEFGFDLLIGIRFYFLLVTISWTYPYPLCKIVLCEYDSREEPGGYDPIDTDPPVTNLFVRPTVNGYAGGISNFWFTATDQGPAASGLRYTKFNLPDYHGYNVWELF